MRAPALNHVHPPKAILPPLRVLAEQAFSRAAGAPLIPGNRIAILKDAAENYPSWLDAIGRAKHWVHFESYFIRDDRIGRTFAEALMAKARAGVEVRMICDWLGARAVFSHSFWRELRRAGVEARSFNPPRLSSPFGWLSRDHRKMIAVDGRVGFVGGLCVGDDWRGNPARGIEPWRDTGVEVHGPAVAHLDACFREMWNAAGPALPAAEAPAERPGTAAAGDVALRIVASMPNTAGLYRLDQLISALARRSIWFTDAYFVGTTPYLQALAAAAMDGVDVRLLVPRVSDVPFVRSLSRAGYRPLLEAGVRIFEWNGTMLHAKTAVADGRWSRVGSSNMNLASWIGNWELDVLVEDERFAARMEQLYLDDLERSTEIVLAARRRVRPAPAQARPAGRKRLAKGSAGRAASGVLAITNTIGAAIASRRTLGPAEARLMFYTGVLVLALAVVSGLWPRVIAIPLAVLGLWVGLTLLLDAYFLWRRSKAGESEPADRRAGAQPPGSVERRASSPSREPGAEAEERSREHQAEPRLPSSK
jgi:cardiolipin synthase A/B